MRSVGWGDKGGGGGGGGRESWSYDIIFSYSLDI